MKLVDYINDCLKDPEFNAYWNNEDFSFLEEFTSKKDSLSLDEAFKLLNEDDFEDILKR